MKTEIVGPKQQTDSHEGQVVRQSVETSPVVREIRSRLSRATQAAGASQKWGWLPEIALFESLCILLIAYAYKGARVASEWAVPLFWIGLAALLVPVVIRIVLPEVSRRERIALVVLLGMAFYLVKVMHSPFAFTFPDELSHFRNVHEILETYRLFQENPILPVTARYPGLQTVTSTLVSLSGLSIFTSGIMVVAVARLILFLALYLLYEQIGGSTRVAALAVVLYMANSNFLYWTSEYAYESLALPLAVFVLYLVARREMTDNSRSVPTVFAMLAVLTVVITHHMTSYVLTALLWGLTLLSLVHSRGLRKGPWDIALFALLASSLWLVFFASLTLEYLLPVLGGAVRSSLDMIVEAEAGRELFKSSTADYAVPLWERLAAFGSVLLVASGVPLGAFEIWRRLRNNVFALMLAAVAFSYFPVQLMRLTRGGWETANRSSEFLFIGVSFLLALAVVQFWLSRPSFWIRRSVLALMIIILFFGGLIAGWPPRGRLPRPYTVTVGEHLVEPQGIAVAKWTADVLGPDHRIAVDKSNAKLLTAYGQQTPLTGRKHGIRDLFFSDKVGPSERSLIQNNDIRYIISDRRIVSWDHLIGLYFFDQEKSPSWELEFIEPGVYEKFDGQDSVARILDSGNIVVYDVGVYLEASPE